MSPLGIHSVDKSIYHKDLEFKETPQKTCCGLAVTLAKKGGGSIAAAAQHTLHSLSKIALDAQKLSAVFGKLEKHVFKLAEQMVKAPGSLGTLSELLRRTASVIDRAQLASDIYYFSCGKFNEDTQPKVAARISLLAANIGGVLLWLEEMAFFNLSKAAAAIGEIRVFAFLPKIVSNIPGLCDLSRCQAIAKAIGEVRVFRIVAHIPLAFVTLRALDLMYLFLTADAAQRLADADNPCKRVHAGLDLSSYLAELTLSAMVFAGVANIIGLGAMGGVCITLTLSSFIYEANHKKELS